MQWSSMTSRDRECPWKTARLQCLSQTSSVQAEPHSFRGPLQPRPLQWQPQACQCDGPCSTVAREWVEQKRLMSFGKNLQHRRPLAQQGRLPRCVCEDHQVVHLDAACARGTESKSMTTTVVSEVCARNEEPSAHAPRSIIAPARTRRKVPPRLIAPSSIGSPGHFGRSA